MEQKGLVWLINGTWNTPVCQFELSRYYGMGGQILWETGSLSSNQAACLVDSKHYFESINSSEHLEKYLA